MVSSYGMPNMLNATGFPYFEYQIWYNLGLIFFLFLAHDGLT